MTDNPCEYYTAGNGERFYLSPDGGWLIWEKSPPTHADEAHRGLIYELRKLKPTSPLLKLLAEVAFEYSMNVESLQNASQTKDLVKARRVFASRARRAGYSLSLIGRALHRHHSTVVNLLKEKGML